MATAKCSSSLIEKVLSEATRKQLHISFPLSSCSFLLLWFVTRLQNRSQLPSAGICGYHISYTYSLIFSRGNIFEVEPDFLLKRIICGKIFIESGKN